MTASATIPVVAAHPFSRASAAKLGNAADRRSVRSAKRIMLSFPLEIKQRQAGKP
jgi:hypothetical protein